MIQYFDTEFTGLSHIEVIQAQTKNDAQMFDVVCQNLINDFGALYTCIKELRGCEQEAKALYENFSMSFNFMKEINDELQKKHVSFYSST